MNDWTLQRHTENFKKASFAADKGYIEPGNKP